MNCIKKRSFAIALFVTINIKRRRHIQCVIYSVCMCVRFARILFEKVYICYLSIYPCISHVYADAYIYLHFMLCYCFHTLLYLNTYQVWDENRDTKVSISFGFCFYIFFVSFLTRKCVYISTKTIRIFSSCDACNSNPSQHIGVTFFFLRFLCCIFKLLLLFASQCLSAAKRSNGCFFFF